MVVAFFSGQIPIAFRPQNKMPVVGHQAITENPHRPSFQGVGYEKGTGPVSLEVKPSGGTRTKWSFRVDSRVGRFIQEYISVHAVLGRAIIGSRSDAVEFFLQAAPAFFGFGKLGGEGGDFIVQP